MIINNNDLIEKIKDTTNEFISMSHADYWNWFFDNTDNHKIINNNCCSYLDNLRAMALHDNNLDCNFYVLFPITYNVLCVYNDWPSSDFDYEAILKFYKNNKKNILNYFFYKGKTINNYHIDIIEKATQSVIDYFCKPTEDEIE